MPPLPMGEVGTERFARDLSPQAGRGEISYTASHENPLPARRIFPVEGDGKCAVQHSVSVSQ